MLSIGFNYGEIQIKNIACFNFVKVMNSLLETKIAKIGISSERNLP